MYVLYIRRLCVYQEVMMYTYFLSWFARDNPPRASAHVICSSIRNLLFFKKIFFAYLSTNLYILNVFMFNVYITVFKLERSRKSTYINMYECMYVCM
jgi:hypothetical protein